MSDVTQFVAPGLKAFTEPTKPDSEDYIVYRSVILFSDKDGENEANRIANMVRKFSVPVKVMRADYAFITSNTIRARLDRLFLFLVLELPQAGVAYHDKVIRVLHFLSGYLGQEYEWMDKVEASLKDPFALG